MRSPLIPTFLALSPFPVKALLGEEPFASVSFCLLAMVTVATRAVITSLLGPNISPRAA